MDTPLEEELDLEALQAELEQLSPQEVHEAMLRIVVEAKASQGQSAGNAEDRELLRETREQLEESGQLDEVLRARGVEPVVRKKTKRITVDWSVTSETQDKPEQTNE